LTKELKIIILTYIILFLSFYFINNIRNYFFYGEGRMGTVFLTYRERAILNSIVVNFINCASPIGSKFLAKENKNNISPATIRNVMMSLEEKGFLTHPHTSAGRMPTDLGYRYYVNGLMTVERLTQSEKEKIDYDLKQASNKNVENILEKACNCLSDISNQLGVVLSPKFDRALFKKLELVYLNEHKLLVIISVSSGIVKKILMEFDCKIPSNKIIETERILNERLYGLTLQQIRNSIKKRMHDVNYGDKNIIEKVTGSANKIFIIEEDNVHFKGTSNIFIQPEFIKSGHLGNILKLIDNQKILIQIIKGSTKEEEKVSITIGKEHDETLVDSCSLISTNYKIGDITGALGVIGPTRMKYEKLSGLVDYIARGLNNLFS